MSNLILYGIGDAKYQYGLKREFQESIKRNSIESCAIFKDTLEREGIQIF